MLVKGIVDYTLIDYERVWDMNIVRAYAIVVEIQAYNKREEERVKAWRTKH